MPKPSDSRGSWTPGPPGHRARRNEIEGRSLTRGADRSTLAEVIALARRAQAKGGRERPDGSFVADPNRPKIAGLNGSIRMADPLPSLLDGDGRIARAPRARPAGETQTLRGAVMEAARTVQAGARLLELPPQEVEAPRPGEPILREAIGRFEVISPASFAPVELSPTADPLVTHADFAGDADEGTVPDSPLPWAGADLDRGALVQRAFRVSVPRSTLRERGEDDIAAQLMLSISHGLAQAVDAEILGAILASEPAGFWFGSAAAKGLRAGSLRALVGRDGNGVSDTALEAYAPADSLKVFGWVPAEFSPAIEPTLIGDYSRVACWVQPEIDVLAERGVDGALIVTCWADFAAALPDAGYFWRAEPAPLP